MFFKLLAACGLLTAAVASPAANEGAELAERAQPSNCSTGVHMFVNRGHITPEGQVGPMIQMVKSIQALIPNSSYYNVPYHTLTANNIFFIFEVNPGAQVLIDNITSYHEQCPQTPIVLLGYSEGAVICMNALCGSSSIGLIPGFNNVLNTSYVPSIIATVLYGDESRAPNQTYNEGSCTKPGSFPRLDPEACAPWAPNIKSYCLETDSFCCNGHDAAAHGFYFSLFDTKMAKFVQSQYKAFKANLTAAATISS